MYVCQPVCFSLSYTVVALGIKTLAWLTVLRYTSSMSVDLYDICIWVYVVELSAYFCEFPHSFLQTLLIAVVWLDSCAVVWFSELCFAKLISWVFWFFFFLNIFSSCYTLTFLPLQSVKSAKFPPKISSESVHAKVLKRGHQAGLLSVLYLGVYMCVTHTPTYVCVSSRRCRRFWLSMNCCGLLL